MNNKNLICLLVRIMGGGLMLFHGLAKLQGLDFIKKMLQGMSLPEFMAYGVYMGEIVAPLMILLGFRARLGALLLMANMLFIIFAVHASEIFALSGHGAWAIELPMFYLFSAIIVYLQGAGEWSLSTKNAWD